MDTNKIFKVPRLLRCTSFLADFQIILRMVLFLIKVFIGLKFILEFCF